MHCPGAIGNRSKLVYLFLIAKAVWGKKEAKKITVWRTKWILVLRSEWYEERATNFGLCNLILCLVFSLIILYLKLTQGCHSHLLVHKQTKLGRVDWLKCVILLLLYSICSTFCPFRVSTAIHVLRIYQCPWGHFTEEKQRTVFLLSGNTLSAKIKCPWAKAEELLLHIRTWSHYDIV